MRVLAPADEPTIGAWLGERAALGLDKRDEQIGGVRYANPPQSPRHALLADGVRDQLLVLISGFVVTREVGLHRGEDYVVPDVIVYRPEHLNAAGTRVGGATSWSRSPPRVRIPTARRASTSTPACRSG